MKPQQPMPRRARLGRYALAAFATCLWLAPASRSAAQSAFQDRPQGYVRLDTDLRQTQVWLGGALPMGTIDLQADLILDGRKLQTDLGVAFYAGALALLPSLGLSFDFGPKHFDRLITPRLFSVLEVGPLYIESWLELTLRDVLHDAARDDFYTRDFILISLHEAFAIGPQLELRYGLRHAGRGHVLNLPIGGQISSRWGGSTFALFLGYETARRARGDGSGFTGRFTFVRTWQ